MEHLIQNFENLNLQPWQLAEMQLPPSPLSTSKTEMLVSQSKANKLICLLLQENNLLKAEIKRLHSLLVVPKARIPNWVH